MTDPIIKKLSESINRSAGQHQLAIRRAFERARLELLARWNKA